MVFVLAISIPFSPGRAAGPAVVPVFSIHGAPLVAVCEILRASVDPSPPSGTFCPDVHELDRPAWGFRISDRVPCFAAPGARALDFRSR